MTAWVRAVAQQCWVNSSLQGRRQAQVVVREGSQVLEVPQERPLALELGLALGRREVPLGKPQVRPAQQQRKVSLVEEV
ncbi:MAG: hypothetical protein OXH24_09740 [Cyanobacteria bacterium MAG IRC3_bin_20]|nr:hypothetical protein [Cyanobacteria bacterium MAG IRC3_bin_20]